MLSFVEIENKIVDLMGYFPEKMRKSGDFDIVFLVVDIAKPYELTYAEIGIIFLELYDIFTGKAVTTLLSKRLKEKLNEGNKDSSNKIADDLQTKVITPIVNTLGNNFPIVIKESESETNYGKLNDEAISLDRNTILSEIENPQKNNTDTDARNPRFDLGSEKRSNLKGVEIRPEMHPEEIYPAVQKVERGLPKPQGTPKKIGSIMEAKMAGITSLPREEVHITPPVRPPQKPYERDPYREQPK